LIFKGTPPEKKISLECGEFYENSCIILLSDTPVEFINKHKEGEKEKDSEL